VTVHLPADVPMGEVKSAWYRYPAVTGQQVERELAALKANKALAAPAGPVVTAG
jgi:hypothetical protein